MSDPIRIKESTRITLVGPCGVGKTSLLASMLHELDAVDSHTFMLDNQVDGGQTERLLEGTQRCLQDSLLSTDKGSIITTGAAQGTTAEKHFYFKGCCELQGKTFEFPFDFCDMPGNWYTGSGDPTTNTQMEEQILGSAATILAIDAPALMSGNLATMESTNKLFSIRELYKGLLPQLAAQQHAVILVLTRCEAFMQTGAQRQQLFRELRRSYEPLIQSLRQSCIPVHATWVETLGGAQFAIYEDEQARFRRTGNYAPRNCTVPLILSLQYGYEAMSRKLQKGNEGIWASLFGTNNKLAEQACKTLAFILKQQSRAQLSIKEAWSLKNNWCTKALFILVIPFYLYRNATSPTEIRL